MDKKLLVICGFTATGKTELAIDLAQQFNGELISADSRQVYRGMDIGTGKDLPLNLKFKITNLKLGRAYYVNGIPIWGYDLVGPEDNFSVGRYIIIARRIIHDIWVRDKLPILVGGTGFYIKAVLDGVALAIVVPNKKLRGSLEKKSPEELFEILAVLDPIKAASMNMSDKKNSRRLVRAVEVAKSGLNFSHISDSLLKGKRLDVDNVLIIGLSAQTEYLNKRIENRVKKRLVAGFEREVRGLIRKGISWDSQAMQSLGYRQFKGYNEGVKTRQEFVDEWVKEEQKYAKRQMTWFKKDKRIIWFDLSNPTWKTKVEKLLRNW